MELPPKKSGKPSAETPSQSLKSLTVLVKKQDVATVQVDGMSSTQAGHCAAVVSGVIAAIRT